LLHYHLYMSGSSNRCFGHKQMSFHAKNIHLNFAHRRLLLVGPRTRKQKVIFKVDFTIDRKKT